MTTECAHENAIPCGGYQPGRRCVGWECLGCGVCDEVATHTAVSA